MKRLIAGAFFLVMTAAAAFAQNMAYPTISASQIQTTDNIPLASPRFTYQTYVTAPTLSQYYDTLAHDFTAGVAITSNASAANFGAAYQAFSASGTLTGTGQGPYGLFSITDTATNKVGGFVPGLWIADSVGASAGEGSRAALLPILTINNALPCTSGGTYCFHIAAFPQTYVGANLGGTAGAGNSRGDVYGIGGLAQLASGATYIHGLNNELNVSAQTGSSVDYKSALTLISVNSDAVKGSLFDAMLAFTADNTTTAKWSYGVAFGRGDSTWPFDTSTTLIGSVVPGTGSPVANNGVDLSGVTFSTCAYKSAGFCINPIGEFADSSSVIARPTKFYETVEYAAASSGLVHRLNRSSVGEASLASGGIGPQVTISIASPAVVTLANHGRQNGDTVVFGSTGSLPTGIVAGTRYYVINAATNTFQISATRGGAAINTSGTQSGTQILNGCAPPISWLETYYPGSACGSQESVSSALGSLALSAWTRTSDFRTWAGSSTGGAQALTGFAINDDTTPAATPIAAAIVGEGVRRATVNGITLASQLDSNNLGAIVDATPYSGLTSGSTFSLELSSGFTPGIPDGHNPVTAFLVIDGLTANNNFARKGIIFQYQSLDTSLGTGGGGIFMEVARGQSLRWLNSGLTSDAEIWGDATGLVVGNGVVTTVNNSDFTMKANGTGSLLFSVSSAARWKVDSSTGSFYAVTDNVYDIGASGASRPKNAYLSGKITVGDATGLVYSSVSMNNGAAAATATLTNAPTAGNPTKWIPINDNGVTRYIPAW